MTFMRGTTSFSLARGMTSMSMMQVNDGPLLECMDGTFCTVPADPGVTSEQWACCQSVEAWLHLRAALQPSMLIKFLTPKGNRRWKGWIEERNKSSLGKRLLQLYVMNHVMYSG